MVRSAGLFDSGRHHLLLLRNGFSRPALTCLTAICLTIVVGAFLGTPVNPVQFRERQKELETALSTSRVFTEDGFEAFMAPSTDPHPRPPFVLAVLDWHAILLLPFGLLATLLFRPRPLPAATISLLSAAVLYFLTGFVPAAYFFFSILFASFALKAFSRAFPSRKEGTT